MKLLSKLLLLVLLLGFLVPANAQAVTQTRTERIEFSDGSYIILETTALPARSAYEVTGSQHYTYYNASDVKQWRATVTGTFTYDGTTSTCTAVSTSFTRYTTTWTLDSVSKSKSGATAIGDFYLSCSLWETSVRVKLTCDKDGNLS